MSVTDRGNFQPHNVHTDEHLSNLALEWKYPDLHAEFFAPSMLVGKQSDKYLIAYNDDENRIVEDARGPGGEFREVEWSISDDTYYCDGHGLKNSLAWETQANADTEFAPYLTGESRARRLKHHVEMVRENKVKTLFQDSANYASGLYEDMDTIAGHNYDDSGGTNGLFDIMVLADQIATYAPGARVVMAISSDAWNVMRNDSNFKTALSDQLLADPAKVKEATGLDEIRVIRTQYNSADKGQTPVRTRMWLSNSLWIFAQAPAGDGETPSAARTFVWQNPKLQTSSGEAVRIFQDEENMVERVQFVKYYGLKLVGVNRSNDLIVAAHRKNVYASL